MAGSIFAPVSSESSVYVIGSAGGPQKIGVATNPAHRLRMIQVSNPTILTLQYSRPFARSVAFKVERVAHLLLAEKRINGDWFDVTAEEAVRAISEAAGKTALAPDAPASGESWQQRARMAGLNQKMLAKLLGVSENTVSQQLRGKWQSGTPQYVKTMIVAWSRLPPEKREAIWREVNGCP